MQTKTQRKYQRKYKDFVDLIENVSLEMFSKDQWDKARADNISLELNLMQSAVYDKAFERKPEAFTGIQWINSTDGITPAWVRPGVDWEPDV